MHLQSTVYTLVLREAVHPVGESLALHLLRYEILGVFIYAYAPRALHLQHAQLVKYPG